MITNRDPGYFRALVEFERDPLPPALPSESAGSALGDQRREHGVDSAQPPDSGPPPGGDCAEESHLGCIKPYPCVCDAPGAKPYLVFLSQLDPVERV